MIFIAGQDLLPNRVVKIDPTSSGSTVVYAGLNEYGVGVTVGEALYGENISVDLLNEGFTFTVEVFGTVTQGDPLTVIELGILHSYSAGQAAQFTASNAAVSGELCSCTFASPRLAPLVTPYFEGQVVLPFSTDPDTDLSVAGGMVYYSSTGRPNWEGLYGREEALPRVTPVIQGQTSVVGDLVVNNSNASSGHVFFADTFDTAVVDPNTWLLTGANTSHNGTNLTIVGDGVSGNNNHASVILPFVRKSSLVLYADILQLTSLGRSAVGFTADITASHGGYSYMPHCLYFFDGDVKVYQNGTLKTSMPYAYSADTVYKVRIAVYGNGATYAVSADDGRHWSLLYDGTGDSITDSPIYAHFSSTTGTSYITDVAVSNGVDPFSDSAVEDRHLTLLRGGLYARERIQTVVIGSNNGFVAASANGTIAAPTHKLADERLTYFIGAAKYTDTADELYANTASMEMWAAENQTSTARGAYITWGTTPIGSTTRSEHMRLSDVGALTTSAGITATTGDIKASSGFLLDNGAKVTTAQYDKTNTTLGSITGLQVSGLLSGRTYIFEAVLHLTNSATSGGKYAISGTGTFSNIIYYIEAIRLSTGLHLLTSRQTTKAGAAGENGGGTEITVIIKGSCVCSSDTNLVPQFACNTGTDTSSVLIGSSFKVVAV